MCVYMYVYIYIYTAELLARDALRLPFEAFPYRRNKQPARLNFDVEIKQTH